MSIIIWAILPLMVIGLIVLRRSKDLSVTTSLLSRDGKFGYFFFVSIAVLPLIVLTSYTTMLILGKGEMYYLWGVPVVYKNFIFSLGLAAIFGLFVVRWIQKRTDIEPIARVYKFNIFVALALLVATSIWQGWYQQEQSPEQITRNATVEELRKSDISKEELLIAEAKLYADKKTTELEAAIKKYRDTKEALLKAEGEIPSRYHIWKDSKSAEANLRVAQNRFAGAKTDLFVLAHGIIAANPGPESFSLTSATGKIKDIVNTPDDFESRPTSDFKIIKHSRNFWTVTFETDDTVRVLDVWPKNTTITFFCLPGDKGEIKRNDPANNKELFELPIGYPLKSGVNKALYIKYKKGGRLDLVFDS